MVTTAVRWLEKATWTTPDITPSAGAGILQPEQAREFLRVAIEATTLLNEARNETSNSPKFEVPRISFASRILRPGVEATRLADVDRVKPTTGLVTLSTVLFKGEVPVSDELFEDNIEGDGVADTVMEMVAQAVGRDLEEIALKSDTVRTGSDLAIFDQLDGVVKQLQTNLPTAQAVDMTGVATYDDMFAAMLSAMPPKYRQNYQDLRLYVPIKHFDGYQKSLAQRGTGLGDQALISSLATKLAFRGVPVEPLVMLTGTDTINSGSINYDKFAMLMNPQNLIVGWHRRVRVEKWRDPREGVTSFLPSLRYDVKFADPEYGVLAYNIGL